MEENQTKRNSDIKEMFREFLVNVKKLSPTSVYHYTFYFDKLESDDLNQEIVNKIISKHGNNSIIRAMILNYREFLEFNSNDLEPIKIKIPKPTGSKKKKIVEEISNENIQKLRHYFYNKSIMKGILFDLILQGALRRIETKSIRFNSFDWETWLKDESKPIRLKVIGKRNKERIVLISPKTANIIAQAVINKKKVENVRGLLEFLKSDIPLFKKISVYTVYDIIGREGSKILGVHIHPHQLRHIRTNQLADMGADIQDIKNYLGHDSIATTEIYLHRSEKDSINNISKILEKK